MRPGQNKRMRGRPNNNGGGYRKGPNPLTRSYESNGPDVKIRGNAHHVAEKYLQLARDAQSSGDPVAAESYLQHAEHYFRLIASAQAAQAGFARQPDAVDADMDEDDDSGLPDRFASPQPAAPFVPPQPAPQPYGERPAYNGQNALNGQSGGDRQPYGERQSNGERPQFGNGYGRQDRNFQDRNGQNRRPYEERQGQDRQGQERPFNDRQSRRERFAQERQERQERFGQDRNGQDRPFAERGYDRPNRDGAERFREVGEGEPPRDAAAGEQPRFEPPVERPSEVATAAEAPPRPSDEGVTTSPPPVDAAPPQARAEAPRRRERPAPLTDEAPGLPSFITTPTRVPGGAEPAAEEPGRATVTAFPGDDAEAAPKFPRRRRRTARAATDPAAGSPAEEPATGE